jgi:ACS family hexuronate transporter-like MFS transporter
LGAGAAQKALVAFGGFGVLLFIPTIFAASLATITLLLALATFCFAAFSTIANVLPSDLFTAGSIASVSGFSGTGAGIGTIIAFKLIGYFSDANQRTAGHSFDKIVMVAGLLPFLGMLLVLLLARNTRATQQGLV